MNTKTGVTLGIEAGMNFIISGPLNGLCAWLIHRRSLFVPLDFWSLFIDTTITCFLVSVCTTFFTVASAKRYRRQEIQLTLGKTPRRFADAVPTAAFPAGCCLFGMCLPVLLSLFGTAFYTTGTDTLTVMQFMLFKGIWGGLYGSFTCLVILFKYLTTDEKHV